MIDTTRMLHDIEPKPQAGRRMENRVAHLEATSLELCESSLKVEIEYGQRLTTLEAQVAALTTRTADLENIVYDPCDDAPAPIDWESEALVQVVANVLPHELLAYHNRHWALIALRAIAAHVEVNHAH